VPVKNYRIVYACLALAMLGGILFFGLRPKDLTLCNNIDWISDRNGIQFRKYSIAFSPIFIESGTDGFSLEMALSPKIRHSDSFSIVLSIDNGVDSQQLVIGQWQSWFIVMNGDDYAHKKKIKRLAVNIETLPPGIQFVTITSGSGGTYLYCNGVATVVKNDFFLKIPEGGKSRIIVGNSAYGKHPWQGDVYGLAIYNRRLAAGDVSENYRQWSGSQTFNYALAKHPLAVYFFDEKRGELARDRAGAAHLELPRRMKVLRRKLLALPWEDFEFNRDFVMDVAANFIAFVPFGFVLLAALSQMGARLKAGAFLTAVSIGILTSLFIEISQSWMPSRSSTLLDLILNSAGTVAGATALMIYARYRHRSKAKR